MNVLLGAMQMAPGIQSALSALLALRAIQKVVVIARYVQLVNTALAIQHAIHVRINR
jgi:hypothetical protein